VAKDRARPFSRKHRKYWLTVTGGMILIGLLDLLLGYVFWPHHADEDLPWEPIRYDVKQVTGSLAHLYDAGVESPDAPTATPR